MVPVARPVLAGTSERGSLVTIYSGTNPIGSVYADAATGAWSWQHNAGERFAEGEHVLTVQAVDPAGNVSAASDTFTLTVDTVLATPLIATVTDAVASGVVGALPDDSIGLTNDPRPVFTGTAERGSLVTIYNGTTPIGSVYAHTGAWSWQYATGQQFAEGEHILTVQAVDPAGNVSAPSTTFTLTVETTVTTPVITTVTDAVAGGVTGVITNDGTGLTNDARPALTGTAKLGSLVTIYSDGNAIGSVYADTDTGAWSWQHATGDRFGEGEHVLTVQAVDTSGNVSAPSAAFTLTVDTVISTPLIATVTDAVAGGVTGAITNDGTGLTNDARPILAGTAERGSLVTVYNNGSAIGSVYADTVTGAWSWQYPVGERFAEGEHVLSVQAVDPAGNVSAASGTFTLTVDTVTTTPLIATVTDAVAGGVTGVITNDGTGLTNDARPVLVGTAERGSLVTIYNGTNPIGSVYANAATGAWSWQHGAAERFGEGEHVLTVQAVDPAGNDSGASSSFIITVDTQPPPVVAGILWDGETLTVQLDGCQYQAGDILTLSIDGTEHQFTLDQDVLDANSISFPWSSETHGNFDNMVVEVIDTAGNISDSRSLTKNSTIIHQENFESQATLTFTNGQTFNFSGFDIKVIRAASGGFFHNITGWEVPSPSMALTFWGTTKIELLLPSQDSDYISFKAGDFNNTERFTVVFFDSLGNEVDRQILTPGGGLIQDITASVPFGKTFSKVTLELNTSGVWIDDIVMGKTNYELAENSDSEVSTTSYSAFGLTDENFANVSLLLASEPEPTAHELTLLTEGEQQLTISTTDVLSLRTEELFHYSENIESSSVDVKELTDVTPLNADTNDWNQLSSATLSGTIY